MSSMSTYSPVRTPNVHGAERWASVIAGGALTAAGLLKRSKTGGAMVIAGSGLLWRGITGRSQVYQFFGVRTAPPGQGENISVPYELGCRAQAAVTINKPRAEVYQIWRDFSNLPRFMRHLKQVEIRDERRSHWVAAAPAGMRVTWDAEVIHEIENERIGWRSMPGSKVDAAGSVQFRDAPGGRGCEILVELQYNPPAGAAGALIAKLFGRDPSSEMEEDLGRLKAQLEAGEIPATEGQPKGGVRQIATAENREPGWSSNPEEVSA
jgi:uncharacterized membrane protein